MKTTCLHSIEWSLFPEGIEDAVELVPVICVLLKYKPTSTNDRLCKVLEVRHLTIDMHMTVLLSPLLIYDLGI